MDQFSSMPLSQIAIDDSSPPIVHYGMHMPIAVSTPTGTDVPLTAHSRKILISRLSQVSLRVHYTLFYHHLVQVQSLCDKVSKGLNKYLQDTEQCHALEVNYSAKNTVVEAISTQSDQSLAAFLPTNDVTMPTEQIDCTLVTCHLQQFLEDYPPSSDKHAFLNVYHMLS